MAQRYPARFSIKPDGITVTFRDFPSAVTTGENVEEAIHLAEGALRRVMVNYLRHGKIMPPPSDRLPDEWMVRVPREHD